MTHDQSTDVRVRRAPRFGAFLVVGGALGAIVTLILTSLFPADPNVGFVALFAYFCLFGIPAGVVIGALIALILDRRSSKRATTVTAEHEAVAAAPVMEVAEAAQVAEPPMIEAELKDDKD